MLRRISGFGVTWTLLSLVLLALEPWRLQAQSTEACVASAEVKSALDALPPFQQVNQTYGEFYERKLAALRALRERYPDDMFVNREYLTFWSGEAQALVAEYKALEEKNAGSPEYLYFYGRTLLGLRTPEAIKLFEQALEKAPAFPWPHPALALIYSTKNFRDPQKQLAHLKAFLTECPSSLVGYRQLLEQRVDDPDLTRESAKRLRAALASRSDAEAVDAYAVLWGLEFRSRPQAEYQQVRNQVNDDLKHLRALELQSKREWYRALEEGYKLVGDQKSADWAKAERQERFPSPWELAAQEKWTEEHRPPGPDAPAEERRAYYHALLDASSQWLKERPNGPAWYYRMDAARNLLDLPPAEVESIGEAQLKEAAANAIQGKVSPNDLFAVAELYAERGIRPERVLELAQRGLEQFEKEAQQPPGDLYDDEKWKAQRAFYQESTRASGLILEIRGTLGLKDAVKAESLLAKLEPQLRAVRDAAGDEEGRQRTFARSEGGYWELMAGVAELKGRRQDAMAFYEDGLLADLRSGRRPEPENKNDLTIKARKLWDALGGTEQGWQAWYASKAAAAAASRTNMTWSKISKPLPPFQLVDSKGKTWTVADLKGKVTLLNFWATW